MVKTARLDDAFSEILKLEAGAVEGQSLPQKDKKRGKKEIIKVIYRVRVIPPLHETH